MDLVCGPVELQVRERERRALGLQPAQQGAQTRQQLAQRERLDEIVVGAGIQPVDAIDDRVDGLDAGADDYLVKPFALRELQARLRALLRRLEPDGPTLSFADLRLDRSAHEVHRGNRLIELSRTEFTLLELFLEHPRQVLTRATLFERVWGYDFGATSNALGVYIGYLRRKTEAGGERRLLHTVRGVGYVLRDP